MQSSIYAVPTPLRHRHIDEMAFHKSLQILSATATLSCSLLDIVAGLQAPRRNHAVSQRSTRNLPSVPHKGKNDSQPEAAPGFRARCFV